MFDIIPQLSFFFLIYIFSTKIFFAIQAVDFHWAHTSKKNKKIITLSLSMILILLFFSIFGIYSNYFFLSIYILYVYSYYKSSFYGLADCYLTPLIMYFIYRSGDLGLLNSDSSFIFKNTMFPEIFITLLGSLVFFSAGYEKKKSEIWKKGIAVKLFFYNPKFKKFNFPFINWEFLFKIFTPVILYSQFLLLFFFVFLPLKLSIIPLTFIFFFLVMLGVFFHYSDLTLPSLIIVGIMFYTLFKIENTFLISYIFAEFSSLIIFEKVILTIFLIIFFFSFLSLIISSKQIEKYQFLKLTKFICRYLFGITKVDVYSENHLDNSIAQKFYIISKSKKKEVFKLYNDDGSPYLLNTFFLPSAYLAISFRLHDLLSQMDRDKNINNDHFKLLRGLCQFIIKKNKIINFPLKIVMYVYQINILDLVQNKNNSDKFAPVLDIDIKSKDDIFVNKIRGKLLKYNSKRSTKKIRYKFG